MLCTQRECVHERRQEGISSKRRFSRVIKFLEKRTASRGYLLRATLLKRYEVPRGEDSVKRVSPQNDASQELLNSSRRGIAIAKRVFLPGSTSRELLSRSSRRGQ